MRRNFISSILIVAFLCLVISCSDSDTAKNGDGMEGLIPVSTKVDVVIDDTKSSMPGTTEDPPQTDLAQEIDMVPIGRCDSLGYGDIGFRNQTNNRPYAVYKFGETEQGLPLLIEKWGLPDGPRVLVIGQVHGNECSPGLLVDELRRRPPENYELWLIPTLNPEGLISGARANSSGIDLNRDGLTRRAPETRALMAITKLIKPDVTVHIHSPLNWIGYFNGSLAFDVGKQLVDKLSMNILYTAGKRSSPSEAFLWQGQGEAVLGSQSILIELPAFSDKEAPGAKQQRFYSVQDIEEVRQMVAIIRDSLDASFAGSK